MKASTCWGLWVLGACCMVRIGWAADPLARWDFDEGQGEVAHDTAGRGHDAALHGPVWVRQGDGFVLGLDGIDDCLVGPPSREMGLGGPLTLEAWLKPTRKAHGESVLLGEGFSTYVMTYYNTELAFFYIGSGGNSVSGKLKLGEWNHVVAAFDGDRLSMWVNGRLTVERESKFKTYAPDGAFMMGTRGRPDLPKFKGFLDRVRVYDRALSGADAVAHFKAEAEDYGFDPAWFRRVKVTPYYYFDREEVVVQADFRGLQPLVGAGRIDVELLSAAQPGQALRRERIAEAPAGGVVEVTFPWRGLAAGDYCLRVTLEDETGAAPVEELTFAYPPEHSPLPAPAAKTAAPLPAATGPDPFSVQVGAGGGFRITAAHGASYEVQSRISWPHGEFNRLTATDEAAGGEASWSVDVREVGADRYEVTGQGAFYSIRRAIEVRPTHVYVKDTYANTSGEDLGLLIYNEIPVRGEQVQTSFLSGYERRGRLPVLSYPDYGPTLFFTDARGGMGLVPIDDVFVVQAVPYVEQEAAGVCTEKFALAPGAAYTMEWAAYPTGSGDYYDFINAFRRAEGRISTVEGPPGFISWGPMNRRQVPDRDFIEKRGLGIGVLSCLSRAADDPEVSIEGIEFMDFPEEMRLLRAQATAIHRRHPNFKVVFHIAHSLYCTDDPDRFADSKVIMADGEQAVWGASEPYISQKRQDEGWTWWIFYPTPGNSFHDAMLSSVDVMMDDLGFDGAFMDGFFAGYISQWSYDTDLRWDGHSAEIDPDTRTIRRKMNSVLLLSQPSLIEYARKIRDKGGVVIGNSAVYTRSICNEKYIIYDSECASGPALHTAPSVTALAAPPFATEKEIYLDMLDKLSWGMLFLYYNERLPLAYPSLAARQFPITFEEVRAGLVKGKERIVTMNSGVYGWPGGRELHVVYKYDDRGAPAAHDFLTTVDAGGVRTELTFARNESAVIEPIPVRLEPDQPVNVRVLHYDSARLRMLLNGKGAAALEMFVGTGYPDKRDGLFTDGGVNPADIGAGAAYRVSVGGTPVEVKELDGILTIPLALDGPVDLVIEPSTE